jgi:hypothetical protein
MWHSGNLEVGSLHFTYWNDEWTWIWFDPVRCVVLVHSPLWLRSAARILCYIPIGWCLTCPVQLGCPNSFVTFLLVDACIARHSQTARSSLPSYWSMTLGLPSPVRLPEFLRCIPIGRRLAYTAAQTLRCIPIGRGRLVRPVQSSCPNSLLHSYWSTPSVPGPVSPCKQQT